MLWLLALGGGAVANWFLASYYPLFNFQKIAKNGFLRKCHQGHDDKDPYQAATKVLFCELKRLSPCHIYFLFVNVANPACSKSAILELPLLQVRRQKANSQIDWDQVEDAEDSQRRGNDGIPRPQESILLQDALCKHLGTLAIVIESYFAFHDHDQLLVLRTMTSCKLFLRSPTSFPF
jgi:hypothetical protein